MIKQKHRKLIYYDKKKKRMSESKKNIITVLINEYDIHLFVILLR